MKRVLCIFPPFCPPTGPPYSITYIVDFLKRNTNPEEFSFSLLDLNAWLHHNQFKEDYSKIKNLLETQNLKEYSEEIHEVKKKIDEFARTENKTWQSGKENKSVQNCLNHILTKKPDIVLMSVVYNSQAFFSLELANALKKNGIDVISGGPAITPQLKKASTYLPHEIALLEHLTNKKTLHENINCSRIMDYSNYDTNDYFCPEKVICLRTTSSCYYQKCTFCTHHGFSKYVEYNLADIEKSILASKSKLVFLIDDMIHKNRLLEISKIMKKLGMNWMCQLRPTKDLDEPTLKILYESGLKIVIWGVESGNNRILSLMDKGTNTKDVEIVLQSSKNAGITNVTYIMFGFPTETKEEFLDTINFLKTNEKNIDLVSTAVFGLQEGSIAEKNPDAFSITSIVKEKRTMLPERITYEVKSGINKEEAKLLRKKYSKTLDSINKFPKEMNIYREQMLYLVSKKN